MRPTTLTISLPALQENLLVARRASPGSQLAAVVKANAYGHGAVDCALALDKKADCLAVASIDEAITLRDAGVQSPILLLAGPFQADEIELAANSNFWLMLHCLEQVDQLLAAKVANQLKVWLKIDSGMHRLGIQPDDVTACFTKLKASSNVSDVVLASHFADADRPDDRISRDLTQRQIEQLKYCNEKIGAPLSLANSAAILFYPQSHHDWVRPGIMLYGSSPLDASNSGRENPVIKQLRPVMSLHSEVIDLRTVPPGDGVGYGHQWKAETASVIATVAAGYGDGYPRHAANGTPVLVDGQLAPLCGRVSMDLITVDVTKLNNVQRGRRVELWGENLSVDTVAQHAGTIGYELLTRMPDRARRVVRGRT